MSLKDRIAKTKATTSKKSEGSLKKRVEQVSFDPVQTNSVIDLLLMNEEKGMLDEIFIVTGIHKPIEETSLHGLPVPIIALRGMHDFYDLQTHKQPCEKVTKLFYDLNPETLVLLFGADVLAMDFDPNKNLKWHPDKIMKQIVRFRKAVSYRYENKETRLNAIRFRHLMPNFYKSTKTIDAFFGQIEGEKERLETIKLLRQDASNELFGNLRLNDLGETEASTAIVSNYLGLDSASTFYEIYNKGTGIASQEFIYGWHFWKWEQGEVKKKKHVDSFKFIKLGDKFVKLNVNKLGSDSDVRISEMIPYSKSEIKEKYCSKEDMSFMRDVEEYEALTLEPDNSDQYSRRVSLREGHLTYNYYNVYEPLTHFPDTTKTAADCPNIISYLKHITQGKAEVDSPIKSDRFTLMLDWLIIAYKYPKIRLPMVVLLSKERGTGKSTLLELMEYLFGANALKTNMEDLLGKFNSHNAYKTYVLLEEVKMEGDKAVHMDLLKDLITGKTKMAEPKGLSKVQLSNFGHFVAASNHEEQIMKIDSPSEDRFFFMKPPVLKNRDPNMLRKMKAEIPAFLHLLNTTEIFHKNPNPVNPDDINCLAEDRLWFKGSDIRTDEFYRIVENSKPFVEREVENYMRDLFLTYKLQSVRIHPVILSDLMKGQTKYNHSPEDIKRVFKEKGHDAMTPNPSTLHIPIGFDVDEAGNHCYRYYVEKVKNTQNTALPKKRFWNCLAEDWLTKDEFEEIKDKSIRDIRMDDDEPPIAEKDKIDLPEDVQAFVFNWLQELEVSEEYRGIKELLAQFNHPLKTRVASHQFLSYLKAFHDWPENGRSVNFKVNEGVFEAIMIKEPF